MLPLEREIERKVVAWARKNGIEVTKLQGVGNRSLPDRVFWIKGGRPLLIEFKRPGGKLTALQIVAINKFIQLGYPVGVFNDADAAIEVLRTSDRFMSELRSNKEDAHVALYELNKSMWRTVGEFI